MTDRGIEDGIRLRFRGESVADGSISLRDLTPALVAVGSLVADGRRELFPESKPIDTRVRATEPGSFIVEFALVDAAEAVDTAINLLNSDGASALKTLLSLLFSGTGLAGLIKWFKGRQPTEVSEVIDGHVRIQLADGDSITIPATTWRAFNTRSLRESMERLASPVDNPGIESLTIDTGDSAPTTITEDDVKYFRAPRPKSELATEEIYEEYLRIHTMRRESNRWWFRNTRGEIVKATVADEHFLARWANNEEPIGGNDVLYCRVLLEQWLDDSGDLKTDVTVLSVLGHERRPANRRELPLSNDDS